VRPFRDSEGADRPVWVDFERSNYEGEADVKSYGGFSFWVRREHDGWYVRTSQAYLDRYGNPNASGTRDWAIFNINVGTMARGGDCSWDTRAGVACGSTGATARIGHYVR